MAFKYSGVPGGNKPGDGKMSGGPGAKLGGGPKQPKKV